jgi:hypothetical protein
VLDAAPAEGETTDDDYQYTEIEHDFDIDSDPDDLPLQGSSRVPEPFDGFEVEDEPGLSGDASERFSDARMRKNSHVNDTKIYDEGHFKLVVKPLRSVDDFDEMDL